MSIVLTFTASSRLIALFKCKTPAGSLSVVTDIHSDKAETSASSIRSLQSNHKQSFSNKSETINNVNFVQYDVRVSSK